MQAGVGRLSRVTTFGERPYEDREFESADIPSPLDDALDVGTIVGVQTVGLTNVHERLPSKLRASWR